MHVRRTRSVVWGFSMIIVAASCRGSTSPEGTPGSPTEPGSIVTLTAPVAETPAAGVQLSTLRPALTVRNGTSTQTGTRVYEFQVADRTDFTTLTASRTGVPETPDRTSVTFEQDLPATARLFWRARVTQGTVTSAWSQAEIFLTRRVGFNRPGELFDPLIHGETVGTAIGATTFVDGVGIRIESGVSYVRYQLPQTVAAGEFSMDVRGLRVNGPGDKLKIFSMLDGPGDLLNSKFQAAAHYRGVGGNPDNCIAFKAVWGDDDIRLEPDLNERSASVFALDPARTYHWQATWTSNSFRVVIRDGGLQGAIIYDRSEFAPAGTGPYAPSPHFAYLGATNQSFSSVEVGSWPGVTYSNVWLGNGPRPGSLTPAWGR